MSPEYTRRPMLWVAALLAFSLVLPAGTAVALIGSTSAEGQIREAARVLSGAHGQVVEANFEEGPEGDGKRLSTETMWWRWTAPASGAFRFSTYGSEFDTTLAVHPGYRGARPRRGPMTTRVTSALRRSRSPLDQVRRTTSL